MHPRLKNYILIGIFSIMTLHGCAGNGNDNATQKGCTAQNEVTACYTVTFRSTWSKQTHPYDFPPSPHFSPLIGGTHNVSVNLWQKDEKATPGIEQMAETGGTAILRDEIQRHISTHGGGQVISGGGIENSPGEVSVTFDVHPNHSFLSLVSMLAPSPDWFVGVSRLDLMKDGVWLKCTEIDLEVYDAGTDDGSSYTSDNQDSSPKQPITKITDQPFGVNNEVKSVGQFIITRKGNGTDNATQNGCEEVGTARYTVTFSSTWSEQTHPHNFPPSPHFSGLIGGTHNTNVKLWQKDSLATPGIEQMAETGGTATLRSEIQTHISAHGGGRIISGGGIGNSPGAVSVTFNVHPHYSFLSLVSMLAPSPDWFVGVSGLNLMENGVWLERKEIDLEVYDAGTDDGTAYTSGNQDSSPKEPITKITDPPFLVDGEVKPIGQFIITRIGVAGE